VNKSTSKTKLEAVIYYANPVSRIRLLPVSFLLGVV
jgi:hypothetical protein